MEVDGIPTDGLGAIQTRFSMQTRRSGEEHRRSNSWSLRSPITGRGGFGSVGGGGGDQQHLMHSYDVEANGLGDLAEDSDEDSGSGQKRTSFDGMTMNGEGSGHGPPRRVRTIETERVSAAGHKSFDQLR